MMLIHSFGDDLGSYGDFQRFASALDAGAVRGAIVNGTTTTSVPLWIGWIDGERRYLES